MLEIGPSTRSRHTLADAQQNHVDANHSHDTRAAEVFGQDTATYLLMLRDKVSASGASYPEWMLLEFVKQAESHAITAFHFARRATR